MTDRYAVIGNPVAHSQSPAIHAAFARQTGEDIKYGKLFAECDAFAPTAARFLSGGGRGLNVTLPFKEAACRLADVLSPMARSAGAVNVIKQLPDGRREGDNTDGVGLVRDLTANLGVPLGGARILLVGAGGAARGALAPLLAESPREVVVANRTAEKAVQLAHRFADNGPVRGCGLPQAADLGPFDVVINSTSAGLNGAAPPLPDGLFATNAVAYDMFYANAPTPFLRWAREHGAERAWDGFGMLVEQAAESFYIWRGIRPDTAPVIAAMRPGTDGAKRDS